MRLPRFSLVPVGALAALTLACSTVDVSSDYDPGADFSALRSWAWVPQAVPARDEGDARTRDPLVQSRIRTAVEAVLGARHFTQIRSGRPDFYVTYHLAIDQGLDVRTTFDGISPGAYAAWGGERSATIEPYDIGTLLIDIADARGTLVWRGKAQSRLQDIKNPEDRERRILDVVTQVLDRFPPQRESK
jgi:hypothetical protein